MANSDTFENMMIALRVAGDDLLQGTRGDVAKARADMRAYLDSIEAETAQAFNTAMFHPGEKTHRDTLLIQVDRTALRAMRNLDNLNAAARQRLRGAVVAAFRVALALA